MSDLLKTKAVAWPARPLGELFRINWDQVVPMASPSMGFAHYSIPAWDTTGGPAMELGAQIESNKTAITKPSVLVSKLNPRKPRVAAVPTPMERTCCSTEFICYQPKQSNEDLNFWADYFASADFSARLARAAVGSTNSHTRAAPKETLTWFVPDVPSAQQQRIAQIFDTLDTAIHETEAIIAKLKQVKQGLLHDLLTRGIDEHGEVRPPPGEAPHLYHQTRLGWVPKGWEVVRLGEVLQTIDAGWSPECPEEPPPLDHWGVLKVSAVSSGIYCPEESKRLPPNLVPDPLIEVRPGDVLCVRANGVADLVGRTVYVDETPTSLMLSDKTLRLVPNSRILGRYLAESMCHSSIRRQISGLLSGTSGQRNISQSQIKSFILSLPRAPEQIEMMRLVKSLLMRQEEERRNYQKLLSLKSGLMDDLLTGRVRTHTLPEELFG